MAEQLMEKKFWIKPFLVLTVVSALYIQAFSQDPLRFTTEIEEFKSQTIPSGENPIVVFTGSSSIRGWTQIDEHFPELRILNRGFGGSQMSDLYYFLDECVLKNRPSQVFIYEGDNDLNAGKTPEEILEWAEKIISKIHESLPATRIAFISAKPSPARWGLKNEYMELNLMFKRLSDRNPKVDFVDIWTKMIGTEGKAMDGLFLEDKLHMNEEGYRLWAETIRPFLIDYAN